MSTHTPGHDYAVWKDGHRADEWRQGMTRKDRLDRHRRDLLMLRHDIARDMQENGSDYITRYLDTAIAGLEVEIQYLEHKGRTT